MSLPIYRLVINEDDLTGVTAVALVDDPAIQVNWQAFSNQKQTFQATNTEKRIISGPLMIADKQILRRDERGEYLVFFDKETIEKIVTKFHRNSYEKNVNPMHNSMALLPGIFMVSDFVINSERGINTPKGYDNLPDGTWFGDFKVENEEIWNEFVKTGVFKGFSVEGFFNEQQVSETLTDQEMQQFLQIFSSHF